MAAHASPLARLDRLLHHPVTETVLLGAILVSVAGTVLEVLVPARVAAVLGWIDDTLAGLFAVELSLRWLVAKNKRRFFRRYWLDILAVTPLWFFRVLRVLRLFRAAVFLERRVSPFRGAMAGRGEPLAIVLASAMLVLLSAVVMQRAEGAGNPAFASFQEALWFATFSLVGGEPIGPMPVTHVGRWTTLILMLGGLTVFGVFVGMVSVGMVSQLRGRLDVRELDIDELEDHVLLCGWSVTAPVVLRELFIGEVPPNRAVVLVTERPLEPHLLSIDGVPRERVYERVGDYTRSEVLVAANLAAASSVILLADRLVPRSAQDGDARTVLAALTIERMKPGIYTVAELHSRDNEALLRSAGVEDVVVPDLLAGMILGSVQRNRGLVRVLDEVLTQSWGNAFQSVPVPARLADRTAAEVVAALYVECRAVVVGVEIDGHVKVNPPPGALIPARARLIVLCGEDYRAG